MTLATLTLKPGKEKSLKRAHPWIFSGAVATLRGVDESAINGVTVRVVDSAGAFLAWAALSPQSQIRARVWSFDEATTIDAAFFAQRIQAALANRASLALDSNGWRLVHAEADGLPGLVVDRYDDVLVTQFGAAGVERWRAEIVAALQSATGLARIYDRSDTDTRTLEGLPARSGWLAGAGDQSVQINEHGIHYTVDLAVGHKTGWYLDQRDNRLALQELVRRHRLARVLNCFCYTGGFSLSALKGGATHVVSVDSSAAALQTACEQVLKNGYSGSSSGRKATHIEWLDADVFKFLREARAREERYDCIVLDPPKFAPTPASVERAARAYKDINLLGLRLLNPGGLLFTFSCSGGVSAELFQKIVAGAAADAGVRCRIVKRMGAPLDHPIAMEFPEGEYLKGLVLQRV